MRALIVRLLLATAMASPWLCTAVQAEPLARLPRRDDTVTVSTDAGDLVFTGGSWGPARRLSFDATGARWNAPAAPSCLRELYAVVDPKDDGEARVYVTSSIREGDAHRSFVAAVQVPPTGEPRLLWSRDDTTLPGLGWVVAAPAVVHGAPRDSVAVASGWSPMPPHATGAGQVLLIDADSGAPLASALRVDVPVPGGLASVDLDADGRTDRLYATDAAMRIWRLQRRAGAPGIAFDARAIADLKTLTDPHAAFLHAPDVALHREGASLSLHVTVGTGDRPGERSGRHWLFRLTEGPDAIGTPPPTPMSRVALDGALAATPLTVAGRQIVVTRHGGDATCGRVEAEPVTVATLPPLLPASSRIEDFANTTVSAPPDARVRLVESADAGGATRLRCVLGTTTLTLCPAVRRLQRDWWSRDDAP